MNIKIEKGIPMPPKIGNYPFKDMEVGDSFLCPCNPIEKVNARTRIGIAAGRYGKLNNMKFTTRQCDEGIRVWRTE